MKRRATTEPEITAPAGPTARVERKASDTTGHSAIARHLAGPHSREEAEERYVAARDAWTHAMHAAASGRPADLASLAIAQEAYEAATAERESWLRGERIAIPVRPETTRRNLEVAVGQELAWRKVLAHEKPAGLLGRIRRRLGGD